MINVTTLIIIYIVYSFFQIRVYAPPDRVNQTDFALQVANVSVDLYTKLFNISYPLPKLGKYNSFPQITQYCCCLVFFLHIYCRLFILFMIRVCHDILFVHCSHVVTCWERANLLALLSVMFYCVFATFLCGVLGQVWCT